MAGLFDYLLEAPSGKQVVPRNMQQVAPAMKEVFGERLPNAALEGPSGQAAEQAAKRGLLGRVLGAATGPIGTAAQAAVYSGDLNEGEQGVVDQRNANQRDQYYTENPEEARSAMAFGQGVSDRALGMVKQNLGGNQGPVGVMAPQQAQDPVAAAPEVQTPTPEQEEQVKKQTEAKRQVVQQGTIKALQTNQVSRPELAKEIVKSDIQRTGQELTPKQFQARVAEETSAMKTMDNSDLSKYVSYALVAAGLIAAFADKTGKAGDAFSSSFNRQLDRNLTAGINTSKLQAKATENAQKSAIETYKLKQGDRGLDIKERGAKNDERRTEGQLGFWDDSIDVAKERVGVAREANAVGAANANATLGLKAQQMDLNRSLFELRKQDSDRDYELGKGNLAVRQQKAASAGGLKGVDITSKTAEDMVKRVSDEAGTNLSKAAQSAVGEQVRVLAKNDPASWARDPAGVIAKAIAAGGYETKEGSSWNPFSSDSVGIRKPKQ